MTFNEDDSTNWVDDLFYGILIFGLFFLCVAVLLKSK